MRVLFFCADTLSGPVRIVSMLEALRSAGELTAYSSINRDMATSGSGLAFDVLVVHRNPSKRQFAWLQRSKLPFLYDIDDLLLSDRKDLTGRHARERDAIRWCLDNAQFVTSSSRYLLKTLERRLGKQLGSRAVYLPNCGLKVTRTRKQADRPTLLWVSSHGQDYREFQKVGTGIAAAARVIGGGVLLIGQFAPAVRDALAGARHVPWIEPRQFESYLSEIPLIAAAPMPIGLAPDEQEFVDCKSDIKAAQYCSLGIAALYSPALPYRESDLPCQLVDGNSAADWERGLIQIAHDYPSAGLALARDPAVAARGAESIARQFLAILHNVREKTGGPFEFRAIGTPTVFRRLEQGLRSFARRYRAERTR